MTPFSWHDAYYSELQSLNALLIVPVAFLAWRLTRPGTPERAVVPEAARFVSIATLVFAVETMLDPIATGPLLKSALLRDTLAATLVPFVFVYLGDLRVLLVARAVMRPAESFGSTLAWAAVTTGIVPIATGALYTVHHAIWPDADGQWLWMIYEAGFLALCVFAARHWLPREIARNGGIDEAGRAFLAALFGYSAAYYALWLAADVLIVVVGLDFGWAIRMLPNQLYYSFWVFFVYTRFFSAPPKNALR